MSDDLVKRLRDWEHVWPEDEGEPEGNLYIAAADRIAALEERLNKCIEIIGVFTLQYDHWPVSEISYKTVREWRQGC